MRRKLARGAFFVTLAICTGGLCNSSAAGQVAGKVVNQDRQPLAGAKVSFSSGQSTSTDTRGVFSVRSVEDGEYTITVRPQGGSAQEFKVRVKDGKLNPSTFQVKTPPPPQQKVSGMVVDGDGKGVPRARLTFSGPKNGPAVTNSEGVFVFQGPAGNYQVTVKAGDKSGTFGVKIAGNGMTPSKLTLR